MRHVIHPLPLPASLLLLSCRLSLLNCGGRWLDVRIDAGMAPHFL
jgi:hypothetical protein